MNSKTPWVDKDGKSHYIMSESFLQDARELEKFCDFLDDKAIETYIEVGVFRGQMLNHMRRRLNLKKCYGADLRHPSRTSFPGYIPYRNSNVFTDVEPLSSDIRMFIGNVHTWEYIEWRSRIGDTDLVFIDTDHSIPHVFTDVSVEFALGTAKYIGMHDIEGYPGPKMFWDRVSDDLKLFEVKIGAGMGIGVIKGPRLGGRLSLNPVDSWKS